MITKILSKALIAGGILIMGISAFAANTATQTLTFSNGIGAELSFSGSTVNFGTITPGVPVTREKAASVSGSSNGTWTITLSGTDFIAPNSKVTIPIQRLSARKSSTDNFTPITNDGIALVTGHSAGEATYDVDYTLKTDMSDNAASGLTTNLTYTISAQ